MLTTYKKTVSVSLSAIRQMAYITSLYEFYCYFVFAVPSVTKCTHVENSCS